MDKNKRTYIRFPTVSPWHPLFGVEPTPAGLEPAVLTVILRGMAPVNRIELLPTESESVVLPLYETGIYAVDQLFEQRHL